MFRIFRHYVPGSLIALVLVELNLFWISMYLGVELRVWGNEVLRADLEPLWPKAIAFTTIMFVSLTSMGLYKNIYREGLEGMILRLGISIVIALAGMSVVFYLFPSLFLGRGAFAWSFVIAVVSVIVVRVLFHKFVGHETFKRQVLVIGAGKRAEQFKLLRRKVDQLGYSIQGFVHVSGEQDVMPEEQVIHLSVPLLEYVTEHQINEVVVALEDRRKSFPVGDLLDCKMGGVDVVDVLSFFERETGKVRLETLHPSWLIFSDGFKQAGLQLTLKRAFDVTACLMILAITWPFMVLATLAILIEGRGKGPVLYRQVRVGQNWSMFQVLKFRSMVVDAEKDGAPQWAKKNDARVTAVGKFIRRTRIDELPQLFNVLRGDMSFIGPRPERPEFVEQLAEKIPYYAERHRVKPGITGWAQIRYPYGASEQDSIEKLQYDLYYVKNYSIFLDCLILFQTAEVVLWGEGAR
ncbi:TIGR03013 family XrtA/PEP-CTERM system glycosyltransferase [Pseudomonadota bacterium]